MLKRLMEFLGGLLRRVTEALTGRRQPPPRPGAAGSGVREPLDPRVPVLSGGAARPYPPDPTDR